jgi:hypothetical protein
MEQEDIGNGELRNTVSVDAILHMEISECPFAINWWQRW